MTVGDLHMTQWQRQLGEVISNAIRKNSDGCQVDLCVLQKAGLDLKGELFADWLRRYELRMHPPSKRSICFTAVNPPYWNAAEGRA